MAKTGEGTVLDMELLIGCIVVCISIMMILML